MQTIILPRCEQGRDLTKIVAFLSALPRNKPWRVRVDELKGSRTDSQNNALFGVAYPPLCAELGCTPEQLHKEMCCQFFGVKHTVFGDREPVRTTTTDHEGKRDVMPYDAFSNFYAKVQQFGAENEVWVPDPDRHLRSR